MQTKRRYSIHFNNKYNIDKAALGEKLRLSITV